MERLDGFPIVRLGGRVIIPVDPFRGWLRAKAESGDLAENKQQRILKAIEQIAAQKAVARNGE